MYDQIVESGQTFECRPSRIFCMIIFVFFILTNLIIASADCNLLIKIGLFLTALLYTSSVFWQQGLLRGKKSIVAIKKRDQQWIINMKNGDESEAILLGESWVSRFACLLLFHTASSYLTRVCLIFPDSVPAHLYRKLRLTVKMYG
jgi:hypothetical protein